MRRCFIPKRRRLRALRDAQNAASDPTTTVPDHASWLLMLRLWGLRLRLATFPAPAGSPAWRLLQDRLAARGSLGVGLQLRACFYTSTMPRCGAGIRVHPFVTINYPVNLSLGSRVLLNRGVIITARAPISIADDVLIGPYVVINSGNHGIAAGALIRDQAHDVAPIVIHDDVWIGAHAVILPGVTIGRGAVVAAGAVVTKDIAAGIVAAGVPAAGIGQRAEDGFSRFGGAASV
jgi:acetyltransferase-like isoleucine patch superfamily enzyme